MSIIVEFKSKDALKYVFISLSKTTSTSPRWDIDLIQPLSGALTVLGFGF